MENNKLQFDRIIYVDLDGVLTNFDEGFKSISDGIDKIDYIKKYSVDKMWKLINPHGALWWQNLPWMPDGRVLLKALADKNIKILTSGSTSNTGTLAINGKKQWVKNNIGPVETIVVDSSHDKQKYARPGDILIDDWKININEWTSQKGIGIWHTSAADSINELYNVINDINNNIYSYENTNL